MSTLIKYFYMRLTREARIIERLAQVFYKQNNNDPTRPKQRSSSILSEEQVDEDRPERLAKRIKFNEVRTLRSTPTVSRGREEQNTEFNDRDTSKDLCEMDFAVGTH